MATPMPVTTQLTRVKALEATRACGKLIKKFYQDAHEGKAQGKKVAWCGVRVPIELLYAMDVIPVFPEHFATYCAAKKVAVSLCERAESAGYSSDLCSYARCVIGHVLAGESIEAPAGGLPTADFFLVTTTTCDTRVKWFEEMARITGKPIHVLELPYGRDTFAGEDPLDSYYVEYHAREIENLIPFLEQQTGNRFNEKRFKEALRLSQEAHQLLLEVYELRKTVPCPMGSGDMFTDMFPNMYLCGTQAAVDFNRQLLVEVKSRVDSGTGVVNPEKFRLMWGNLPFWYNLGLFNYFDVFNGAIVIETSYYIPIPVDPNDPFRGMARKVLSNPGNCSLSSFSRLSKKFAMEYKVDGAVLAYNRSCRPLYAIQMGIQRFLEEEVGIPVVLLESDMADERNYSDAQVKTRLDALVEVIRAKKG
ncbi:MAG: 2-hydroxyacyl-CoA dehydratase subunit D [Bacillota bacterium]